MKTIGLIGGMSWESTQTYYRLINQRVREELGGLHSAKLVLYSVDFAEVETLQHQGDWQATGEMLASVGRSVESAGAEFLVLCTNTMHKVAPQIEHAVSIPLLHIADATAKFAQRGWGNLCRAAGDTVYYGADVLSWASRRSWYPGCCAG